MTKRVTLLFLVVSFGLSSSSAFGYLTCTLAVTEHSHRFVPELQYRAANHKSGFNTLSSDGYRTLMVVRSHLEWLKPRTTIPHFLAEYRYWNQRFSTLEEYVETSRRMYEVGEYLRHYLPQEDRQPFVDELNEILLPKMERLADGLTDSLKVLRTQVLAERRLLHELSEEVSVQVERATANLAQWGRQNPEIAPSFWNRVRSGQGSLSVNIRVLDAWHRLVEASRQGKYEAEEAALREVCKAREQFFIARFEANYPPQEAAPALVTVAVVDEEVIDDPAVTSLSALREESLLYDKLNGHMRTLLPEVLLTRLKRAELPMSERVDPAVDLGEIELAWMELVESFLPLYSKNARAFAKGRLAKDVQASLDNFILAFFPRSVALRNEKFELRLSSRLGQDKSAMLISDLEKLYIAIAREKGWKVKVLKETESAHRDRNFALLEISGLGAIDAFEREAGIHTIQMMAEARGSDKPFTNYVDVSINGIHSPSERHVRTYERRHDHVLDSVQRIRIKGSVGEFFRTTEALTTLWRESDILNLIR